MINPNDPNKQRGNDTDTAHANDHGRDTAAREFVDAYFGPGDYYRERVNSSGEVDHVEHDDGPMQTRSDAQHDGAHFEVSGRPPRKEEGTKEVSIRLANALSNRTGLTWRADVDAPAGPER